MYGSPLVRADTSFTGYSFFDTTTNIIMIKKIRKTSNYLIWVILHFDILAENSIIRKGINTTRTLQGFLTFSRETVRNYSWQIKTSTKMCINILFKNKTIWFDVTTESQWIHLKKIPHCLRIVNICVIYEYEFSGQRIVPIIRGFSLFLEIRFLIYLY